MSLVTQHGKTRDPRSGHSITTTHYLNSTSPPLTVCMAPRPDSRPPLASSFSHCPDCGQPLTFGSWPFCPH